MPEDQTAWERDQTASESDQSGSESDQTGSDRDQTAADNAQAASDSDQAASDQDQEASDRRDLELAHERLSRNREDRRQAILDMVPIGIYAKDSSGRYVVPNARPRRCWNGESSSAKTDDALMSAEQAESYRESEGDRERLHGAR